MHYLTNVIFTANDNKMLKEHVELERALGVESFLIFDGTNFPPYPRDIFRGQNDVEIVETKLDTNHTMHTHFTEAAIYLEDNTRWIIYNDTDEILIPNRTNDLREMMEFYEDCSQVCFCWLVFGSSFHEKEPIIPTFDAYTRRAPNDNWINGSIKSVSNPKEIISVSCSHFANMKEGCIQQVNEYKEPISGLFSNRDPISGVFNDRATHDIGWIAHYRERSREHYETVRGTRKIRCDDNTPFPEGKYPAQWNNNNNEIVDFRVRDLYRKLVLKS